MSEKLKIGWVGYGGNSIYAEELRPTIEELGMELFTIHEWDSATIKWDRFTWLDHLKKADIIIVPANYKIQNAKSNNRLTQAMSLGKPVICSPLPAYLRIAEKHPNTFLIADTLESWKEALQRLRDDPGLRTEMGKKAREASKDYSIDAMAAKWLQLLGSLDAVDIVIPTYKNLRGIKLCLESIRKCTQVLHKVIIVNNGTDEALHQYLDQQRDIIYIKKGRSNFAQAVNEGIKAGRSKYVCILNDDVIVSKGWLETMVESCRGDVGAVGPLSNCDQGWLHKYNINIGGVDLGPGTNSFDQIEPIIDQIYDYKSPYNEMPEQQWVAFYCTLIPRAVVDKVGLLNEDYTNSGEDVDYNRRIRKLGYRIIQNYNSFVFHFGALSRRLLELEDPESYHAADFKTNEHLKYLWGRQSVMIYSGPAWERFDFRNLETTGIGGSEVWLTWLSRKLSELGYRVTVFADCPESGIKDGDVLWLHYTDYNRWLDQHWTDYAILSRTTDPLRMPLRAGKIFVQLHDVWALSDRNQTFLDKVTKYCVLSDWHLDFASDYHSIPKNQMVVMANGIDLNRFDNIHVDRNPYRLHWSSSWDRGLDNVLYLWPFIKKEVPEAELHCFYGLFNWKQSCISKNDQNGLKKIAELEEAVKQPGIFTYGRVNQKDLAIEISKASLCLYPTWFSETWGITFVECQYAGVPVICNKYAGLITTLGDSAIMLGNKDASWPYSKEGRERFLSETVSILKDKVKWLKWSEKGRENARKYSWENCALNWQKLFKE
jgi:GT2 family glycosyltransferase